MVKMGQLVLMVRQDLPDLLEHLAMMVPMENLVLQASRVLKANLVKMVWMVTMERQGLQVHLVKLEHLGSLDLQVHLVLMALTATAM